MRTKSVTKQQPRPEHPTGGLPDIVVNAIENLSDIFVLWDADDRLVMCNDHFREINREVIETTVPGTRFCDHIRAVIEAGLHPGHAARREEWLEERIAQHREPKGPFELARQDGRWLLITEQKLPDGSTVTISTDITERKRMEAALKASEANFRSLIEDSAQGFCIHDHYRPVFANQALAKIFGFEDPAALLELKSTQELWAPRERERLVKRYEARLRGEQLAPNFEVEGVHRDGAQIWLQMSAQFVTWQEKQLVACTIIDVTEQKLLKERLAQAQRLEAIGQLTGGIAHDFNNLLTIIALSANMLSRNVEDENAVKLVKTITRSTRRGADLIQRMLASARQQALEPTDVRLGDICSEVGELLQSTIDETIAIETQVKPALWSTRADRGQVENAILNLAINARDAMPEGGRLLIVCENVQLTDADGYDHAEFRPGDYVALRVSDTGTGMTSKMAEHAFEPFYTTKEIGKGSGLGLSMVYGFAKQSGGYITIESTEGQGTTINVYLPRALPDGQMAAE